MPGKVLAKEAKSETRTRLITTNKALADSLAQLSAQCPLVAHMYETAGAPALRRQTRGFPGLVRIILGQQVSAASAASTFARVRDAIAPLTPERLLAMSDVDLRALGISRPKQKSLRALSQACMSGALNFANEAKLSDAALREMLTQVSGIGPWSADIYLIFCLGRADAFAPGDLALQVAVQIVTQSGERPTADELEAFAQRWRPYRGVAARMLWTYYEHNKQAARGA